MSRGNTVMYMAWGAVIDDISVEDKLKSWERSAGSKALDLTYVAGPPVRIEETDLVSFQVDIETQSTLAELYARVELSFDGDVWYPMTAGTAPAVVGVAPNQVLESEALPLDRKFVISGDNDGFHMNYELRATFCRLLLRGDVASPGSAVRALAGI